VTSVLSTDFFIESLQHFSITSTLNTEWFPWMFSRGKASRHFKSARHFEWLIEALRSMFRMSSSTSLLMESYHQNQLTIDSLAIWRLLRQPNTISCIRLRFTFFFPICFSVFMCSSSVYTVVNPSMGNVQHWFMYASCVQVDDAGAQPLCTAVRPALLTNTKRCELSMIFSSSSLNKLTSSRLLPL